MLDANSDLGVFGVFAFLLLIFATITYNNTAKSRFFYQHLTGCGRLPENTVRDLDSYEYTPQHNDWVRDNNDKLVLG